MFHIFTAQSYRFPTSDSTVQKWLQNSFCTWSAEGSTWKLLAQVHMDQCCCLGPGREFHPSSSKTDLPFLCFYVLTSSTHPTYIGQHSLTGPWQSTNTKEVGLFISTPAVHNLYNCQKTVYAVRACSTPTCRSPSGLGCYSSSSSQQKIMHINEYAATVTPLKLGTQGSQPSSQCVALLELGCDSISSSQQMNIPVYEAVFYWFGPFVHCQSSSFSAFQVDIQIPEMLKEFWLLVVFKFLYVWSYAT